ncbi:uncharacterized protein PITG_09944 [Phytophthora infestans T30-4]|uniref:Uncharacterized protein n=1 Tax=Phytophthora infestans (strain T30-4) TaxID=403677 RepID=D0NDX0_PHYIT|nr:uncharacterized protein PITG_09944 [Phytophthora infestans T30-4]EEY56415.1 hypothetical protein PITG_09944 [Phytophthora infestans T30-4]|eukprot:XP_002902489.1 hypothetical protein PITG_09944 [Phytophthora infestans T30-4]
MHAYLPKTLMDAKRAWSTIYIGGGCTQCGGAFSGGTERSPVHGGEGFCYRAFGMDHVRNGHLGPMHSGGQPARTVASIMDPKVSVSGITLHPQICRLVCIRQHKRHWQRSRHHYRTAIAARSKSKGLSSAARRQRYWDTASIHAGSGLAQLKWHRLRRIVELGPWGEQLPYNVKTYACSLYDPTKGFPGFAHRKCVT